jgi:uncharacterized protein with gpF-like domain
MIQPQDIDYWLQQRNWQTLYGADVEAELTDLFEATLLQEAIPASQAHLLAVEYAQNRSASLIDSLKDTTRNSVRSLVAQTIKNGGTVQDLKAALQEGDVFGAPRARTIARTETAKSLGAGSHTAAISQGRDQKQWQASGDACEVCQENATGDWLDINDSFPSGDDTIPAHPNCTCNVVYRTAALHEED